MRSPLPPNVLLARVRQLVIAKNALETVVAAWAAAHVGSVALAGFALLCGMDGVRAHVTERPGSARQNDNEAARGGLPRTQRLLLGLGALGAGGYVLLRSAYVILAEKPPAPTLLGELVVELSIVLTVVIFAAGRRLLPPSHFDGVNAVKGTALRLALAAGVLTGLLLNAGVDLWKADPLSALPVAGFLFYAGERLLREEAPEAS